MSSAGRFADEPLFQNADHALRFAYGRRSPFVDSVRYITDMLVRRGRTSPLGELSPQDRIAQAGMILAFVGRMRQDEQACIEARYTRDLRRAAAQQVLTGAVLPCLTGVTHRRMIYELVARHYGKKVHLGMLAKRFTVRRSLVTEKREVVERELQRVERRADGLVILYLQMAGLVRA